MENNSQGNVIPLNQQKQLQPLFRGKLRDRLESTASGFTDKPQQTITALEHTLCAFLIDSIRSLFDKKR